MNEGSASINAQNKNVVKEIFTCNLKKTNGKRMDNQLRKRKQESINLQKSSTCLPKVNNENAVPKSSTYGFVSHFDEEELLRSHNFNLSTTIGLRKHSRKTNRELSTEHKASHKKQCERIGCADAYSDNNESKHVKADKFTLETRCAPDRFCSLVGNLSEDKKNAIRDIGFGSLLEIQCGRLRRQLCRWLVDQFKPECNIIELHGQNLKLCHRTFSDVMGVKDGGIPIQLGGPSENIAELRDIFQSTVKGINIKTLEDIIKQEDKTSWIFKVAFTLFALATLLCPTSGYISHLFLHPCNDVLNVKSLNWASFCYKWLAKSIGKYKNRETTYVGGCLLFLQIFYIHNVAYNCIQPDGTKTPVTFWKESMVKRFMKWLRSQGGIGSNKIQMRTTDTGEASRSKVVRHLNFEEIIQKQILAIRVLTFKVDYLSDAISDQTKMLKELLHQRQIMDRVAPHVHYPTTDNIKTPSHEFVSAQENNVGAEFIEISSNESSARGYDKINSPYDGSSLNTKERQLYQILRTLEMAMDCEKTDALPSKKMEMSKGKQELILKDSKEGLVMIQSTAKGMHIQTSKKKNVNLKSTQPQFLAGPFSVPTPFTEDEKKLILYLFDDKLAEMDVVVRTEYSSITQSSMRSLLPRAWIDGDIITMYAEYKTVEEAQKDITSPRCWFLPSYYSQVVLGDSGDLNPYRRASRFQERYMPQLETCEKIYVPIHCEAHWYMLVIDILRQTADIWDSLESLSQREKMINQSLTILASLDFLLLREARLCFGSNFNFLHFQLGRQTGLPQQPNDFDCGYYTLKYMDNPSIVADQSYQHDSDYARILLALYLAQSPLNDIRHKLMQDASNGYGKCSAADSQRAPCKQTSELRKAARNINLNQTPSEALLKTLL